MRYHNHGFLVANVVTFAKLCPLEYVKKVLTREALPVCRGTRRAVKTPGECFSPETIQSTVRFAHRSGRWALQDSNLGFLMNRTPRSQKRGHF